jgi:hypothetical protein
MYPAEGLGNGLYSINDLPDTIILQLTNIFGDGFCPRQTLSKSNDQFLYGYGDPYDSSPNVTAARVSYFFSEEESRWVFRYDQVLWNNYDPNDPQSQPQRIYLGGFESDCLLLPYFPETLIVDDQFADSYTVTPNIGDSASPTVVTRISLCVWRGTDTCGNFVYLNYGAIPEGQDLMWNVNFSFYIDCELDGRVSGQKNSGEFQNTPVGTYSGTFEDSAFVS